jgi:arylsulfatase A-like enzyme
VSRRINGATASQIAVLAAPFVVVSIWLWLTIVQFGVLRGLCGALSGLALATAVVTLSRCTGRYGVLPGVFLYVIAIALCAGDAVSWFMQGSSFNERFFVHVNNDNVRVSLQAYPWAIVGVVLGLACLVVGAGIVLLKSSRRPASRWLLLPALGLVVLALTVDAPPKRLYGYFAHAERTQALADSDDGDRIRAMVDAQPSRPDDVKATPGRNLVFIYLESVERTYTDAKRFPGLTPNIDRLRRQGLDFSGFDTFPGVTYTISGIFSSQCGAPYLINSIFGDDFGKLGFVPNNDNTSAGSFHPQLACMGDVLHAAGYDQTYLSGVALGFANTDVFFHMHRYDRALGRPEIQARHGGKLPVEGWGLLDSDMYGEALAVYREKQAAGRPFSVVFSTIDTHPPEGYMLPGCEPYPAIRNDMLDAVHCTDRLLGEFIARLSREPGWKDTLLVVMSDHISMRNVASPLYPPDDQRKPLLFVLNAGQGERSARMYHMDIAPTVLSLLGVHSNVRFMTGADRSKPTSRGTELPTTEIAQAVLRDLLWEKRKPPAICSGGVLAGWSGNDGLDIGGWKLPLMLGGFPIHSLDDNKTLLVFVDGRSAQLQVLTRGDDVPWLASAREKGTSVFQVTPFWDDDGQRALALSWTSPGGAWASLGQVPDLSAIHLNSTQCAAAIAALDHAKPGSRQDLSGLFHQRQVAADRESRPGFVVSRRLPPSATPVTESAFMYSRLTDGKVGYGTIHINGKKRVTVTPGLGKDNAAWADFDVTGLSSLTLEPRVDNLFGQCAARTDTGIVGLRVLLDGKQVIPRFIVDRNYTGSLDVVTHGARSLRIEVDEGNSINDCDYFAMGFSHISTMDQGGLHEGRTASYAN